MRICLTLCLCIVAASCDGSGCSSPTVRDAGGRAPDAGVRSKLGSGALGDGWEVVDPYCGMKIRRAEAASTTKHRGRTYYFCLDDHRAAFARDPDRYLSPPEDGGISDGGGEVDGAVSRVDGAD